MDTATTRSNGPAKRRPGAGVATQRGYLMVSIMLALFVTASLMMIYAERQSEHNRIMRGERVGHALALMGAGLEGYIQRYYDQLARNQRVDARGIRINNPRSITPEQLISVMALKGVAPVPPVVSNASYKLQIVIPDRCNVDELLSEPTCRITGLAYIDKPVSRGTNVDYVALLRAVRVMSGQGGYSSAASPAQLIFSDGAGTPTLPIRNPAGTVAGILARRANVLSASSAPVNEYLRTDGGNAMKAPLRMGGWMDGSYARGGHDILGVKNLRASGDVDVNRVEAWGNIHTQVGTISAGPSPLYGAGGGKIHALGNGAEIWSQGKIWADDDIIGKGSLSIAHNMTAEGWLEVRGKGIWAKALYLDFNSSRFVQGEDCGTVPALTVDRNRELYFCGTDERTIGRKADGGFARGKWQKVWLH